jgi:Phage minor structural protein GP20.
MSQVDDATSQVENQPVEGNPQPTSQAAPTMTLDEALAALSETRKEAARNRTRLREFEKAEEDRRQAALSETELLTERATQAETRLKEYEARVLKAEIKLAAAAAGFAKPEMAHKFLDAEAIELDEQGNPTNLADLLATLKESEGWLFDAARSAAPTPPEVPTLNRPGGGAAALPEAGVITRAQMRDPEFFAKHKDAIKAAIREGRVID